MPSLLFLTSNYIRSELRSLWAPRPGMTFLFALQNSRGRGRLLKGSSMQPLQRVPQTGIRISWDPMCYLNTSFTKSLNFVVFGEEPRNPCVSLSYFMLTIFITYPHHLTSFQGKNKNNSYCKAYSSHRTFILNDVSSTKQTFLPKLLNKIVSTFGIMFNINELWN